MVEPRSTLVIVGTPRSGSTLLCKLMAETGQLGRPREYFRRAFVPDDAAEETSRAAEPGRFDALERANVAKRLGTTPNGVCAFKIFRWQFRAATEGFRLLDAFGPARFILMRRDDLLGQAISFVLAKQTGRFRSSSADRGREPRYDGERIETALRDLSNQEAEWRRYFARNGIEPLVVAYEALLADPADVLRAIGRLAGVDVAADAVAMPRDLGMQRNALNEAWRERFRREQGDLNRLDEPTAGRETGLLGVLSGGRWRRGRR